MLTEIGFFLARQLERLGDSGLSTPPTIIIRMEVDKEESRGRDKDDSEAEEKEEWDSQYCRRLQDELLSVRLTGPREAARALTSIQSSPRISHAASPSHEGSDHNHHNLEGQNEGTEDIEVHDQIDEGEGRCIWPLAQQTPRVRSPITHHRQFHVLAPDFSLPAHVAGNDDPELIPRSLTSHLRLQRDLGIRSGTFDSSGNQVLPSQSNTTRAKMDDLTQMSSLSPTQENPASAYAHYALQKSVDTSLTADVSGMKGSEHAQRNVDSHDPQLAKHHSTVTDSTARTYGENDTGHVHFDDFAINENPSGENSPEREESLSQDVSFAPRVENVPHQQTYEPQTPAPPVNPFLQKGSVLKSNEMFKATQPSSIGKHILSATSSRPSPDVYNDFTSPAKWTLPSSPLVRRFEPVESSPLQSSVRILLRSKSVDPSDNAPSPPIPGAPSYKAILKSSLQSSAREPLEYVSMKESQERRKKETSLPERSDTDSESDLDDIPAKRQRERKQRDEEIQRQLSAVELHKHVMTSSRPASPSPGEVEVPSTSKGRGRSLEEEYIVQCEGTDARDTEQDDVIVDSQTVADSAVGQGPEGVRTRSKDLVAPQKLGSTVTGDSNSRLACSVPSRYHDTELERGQDLELNTTAGKISGAPNGSGSPLQPSLPLNEVSTNRNDLRTPSVNKINVFSDGVDMTVPETSPSEDHIRPMGEIASMSFGENNADELQGLPGFTQDSEFGNAIAPQLSPDPATSRTRNRRSISHPVFAAITTDAEAQTALSGIANVPADLRPKEPPFAVSHDESILVAYKKHSEQPTTETGAVLEGIPLATAHDERGATTKSVTNQQHDKSNFAVDPLQPPKRKTGLRSIDVLKRPSRSLRGSAADTQMAPITTPKRHPRTAKTTPATKTDSTRSSKAATASSPAMPSSRSSISTPRSVVTRSWTQKAREETPVMSKRNVPKAKRYGNQRPSVVPPERLSKRKMSAGDETSAPQRESKRRLVSATRESSADPLCLSQASGNSSGPYKRPTKLFSNMAFAVSYIDQQEEKDTVTAGIIENGGWILEDGFDVLFDQVPASKARIKTGNLDELIVSTAASKMGFVALIADEHSRRVKYMQALALGLPCISGKWISECILREDIVNWAPYLLCAGRSSFLGNAIRSRTLQPYSALDVGFRDTWAKRAQFLEGKSILAVTGKGSTAEKRQHYLFLMRVLGPSRLDQVSDLKQARKTLLESTAGQSWDLLYVGDNEKHAEEVIFGQSPTTSAGSKKRKKGSTQAPLEPAPERVRIISDEIVIQSLILGQWLE